jgi:TPR repeat protein
MKSLLMILVLSAVVWAPPTASRADQGWDHMQRGDLVSAYTYWRPRADAGDPSAMAGLAHIAAVRGDHEAAVRWHHRAAARGDLEALNLLGSAYLEGRGVPRDPMLAYAWYHLASLQGRANAARARDLAGNWLTDEQAAEARALAARWRVDGTPESP